MSRRYSGAKGPQPAVGMAMRTEHPVGTHSAGTAHRVLLGFWHSPRLWHRGAVGRQVPGCHAVPGLPPPGSRRRRSCPAGRSPNRHPASAAPAEGSGTAVGRAAVMGSGICAAGSTYQERTKHGNGGEEVPDVVVVKEVEQDAVTVVLPGLRWCFLSRKGQPSPCLPHSCPSPCTATHLPARY